MASQKLATFACACACAWRTMGDFMRSGQRLLNGASPNGEHVLRLAILTLMSSTSALAASTAWPMSSPPQ